MTPGHNHPQRGPLERQHRPRHWEEILTEEILGQTLRKKDNKSLKVKNFCSNTISKNSDNCKNIYDTYEMTGNTYFMNLSDYC